MSVQRKPTFSHWYRKDITEKDTWLKIKMSVQRGPALPHQYRRGITKFHHMKNRHVTWARVEQCLQKRYDTSGTKSDKTIFPWRMAPLSKNECGGSCHHREMNALRCRNKHSQHSQKISAQQAILLFFLTPERDRRQNLALTTKHKFVWHQTIALLLLHLHFLKLDPD